MLNRVKDVFDLQLFAETQEGSAEGAESGGDVAEQVKMYDEKYVKQLRAEAAKYRSEKKEIENSSNQKLTDFQSNIFKALGLEPDPNKNYEKQISEWKSKAQEAEVKANNKLIQAEVKFVASSLGIINPDLAYKAMDMSEVKVKEDGTVTGVKEALEGLLKENPYLKGSIKPIGGPSNPRTQSVKESNSSKMNTMIRKMAGRIV